MHGRRGRARRESRSIQVSAADDCRGPFHGDLFFLPWLLVGTVLCLWLATEQASRQELASKQASTHSTFLVRHRHPHPHLVNLIINLKLNLEPRADKPRLRPQLQLQLQQQPQLPPRFPAGIALLSAKEHADKPRQGSKAHQQAPRPSQLERSLIAADYKITTTYLIPVTCGRNGSTPLAQNLNSVGLALFPPTNSTIFRPVFPVRSELRR